MDDDLLVGEVAVFDAQACTLHDAQSSTIQEEGAYFRGAHVLRMTLVVKQDETPLRQSRTLSGAILGPVVGCIDPEMTPLGSRPPQKIDELWTVRVGAHYRALGLDVEDGIYWIWIDTHAEYDTIIA
jgi:hypothetical protein